MTCVIKTGLFASPEVSLNRFTCQPGRKTKHSRLLSRKEMFTGFFIFLTVSCTSYRRTTKNICKKQIFRGFNCLLMILYAYGLIFHYLKIICWGSIPNKPIGCIIRSLVCLIYCKNQCKHSVSMRTYLFICC